jgi:hypothetical protein
MEADDLVPRYVKLRDAEDPALRCTSWRFYFWEISPDDAAALAEGMRFSPKVRDGFLRALKASREPIDVNAIVKAMLRKNPRLTNTQVRKQLAKQGIKIACSTIRNLSSWRGRQKSERKPTARRSREKPLTEEMSAAIRSKSADDEDPFNLVAEADPDHLALVERLQHLDDDDLRREYLRRLEYHQVRNFNQLSDECQKRDLEAFRLTGDVAD